MRIHQLLVSLIVLLLSFTVSIFAQGGADGLGTRKKPPTQKPNTTKKPTPKPAVTKPTTRTTKKTTANTSKPKFVPHPPTIEMVKIPAGSFMMGSVKYNDAQIHRVIISYEFYMGKYEVTQAQWKAVMGNNPSHFKGDDLPVDTVNWDDAQVFIQRLNNLQNKYQYRLPSEAEWEYACRAGATGDDYSKLDSIAWYGANSGHVTHPVGEKKPNAFGLYDMSGNVWEWCEDLYGSYPSGEVTDPMGAPSGLNRVRRGGSWFNIANNLLPAVRISDAPSYRFSDLGFRLVARLKVVGEN